MVKINEENQDSTLNGDNQENQAKQNAKSIAKNATNKAKNATKKVLNNKTVRAFILAHLPIIIGIIIAILLIIFLIGIIMLLITMPGLILGKLDEMAGNIWGNFSGYFTGDSTTAKVTKQDVLDLAQYVENMGYDIQTYGLGDVTYKDDGKGINNRNGKTREIEKIGKSVDGKDYLQAYIAADENTYVLAQYNMFGAVKAAISDIFDNNKDSTELGDNEIKTPEEESKKYSTGMINIEGYDEGLFHQSNSSYVSIDREKKQMVVYTKALELLGPAQLISRTFFNTESIKWGNVFTYDLDNWLARYGRPKELFLAIHLSTMMPDLAYTIATDEKFNTKVNIGMEDVNLTFDVSATKDDETIKTDKIIDLFLNYCLKEKYRKDFSNASEDEKIEYFNEIWSKILKDHYFDKSDDKIPGQNWTYNEIICLAELAYKGDLSKTISYTNFDTDIDNRLLFFLGVLEEGTCGDYGDSYGTVTLNDGAGATTAFGLTQYVYSGKVAKMYPDFLTHLNSGRVPKKEAQDVFVLTCEAAKEDILSRVKDKSKLTTNYLCALIDLHHAGPGLCYDVINILNQKGSLTVEDFANNWGTNWNYADALQKRGIARGHIATEGRYLLYNAGMQEINFKSSTPWDDFCSGKPSSELYTLGQADGGTTSSSSGGMDGIKWPFIRSVTHHWFYEDIDFTKKTYRIAKAATKMIDYEPSDKNDPLNKENISVKLNATLQADYGIIYQVCEPEAEGPNENIIKVFKDNTYYAYDGSLITAKKIANAKAKELNKDTYTFNGEKYSTKSDMPIEKRKVNFEKNKSNTLTAFSILGNVHTEAAEYIYRNLKELVLKLGFLSKNDLKEELKEILLWPIKTENQYTKWETDRDPENWGGTIKCNAKENTVIAPSDAIVEKIEGDSITLKFTTINDETVKLYDYIYNKRGSNNNNKDNNDNYDLTQINKDILTGMKITISNIEIDSSISQKQSIKRGQTLGKAKNGQSGNGEIKITMQAIDESIVEDLSEYFMQKHNSKYEEIMKYQMDNINKKEGIDIGNWGTGSSSENYFDSAVYPGNTNYAKVYNYLINRGFSRAAACGILGNLVQETTGADPNNYTIANMPDCNPKAESGMVIGIYQFTGGNYTRFINWCNKNNKDKYDPIAQTEFMIECIRSDDWINDGSGPYYGESGATEKEFEKSKNPETAASDFCAYYERCGGDESKSRLKTIRRPWAKKFYNEIPEGGFTTGNADTSTWTKKGKVHIPVYKQSGQPWSNVSYGNGKTISSSGCGACALAMGVSGLTRNNITPDVIANLTKNAPTYSSSISEPGKMVANKYNLTMEARNIGNGMTNEDFTFIDRALDSGKVLVFSGSYTASGHYIIVYGKEGNNYYAADSGRTTTPDTPYSRNSNIFTKAHYQMIALGRK